MTLTYRQRIRHAELQNEYYNKGRTYREDATEARAILETLTGKFRMTLREIEDAAGMSHGTFSRVLQGQPKVMPETLAALRLVRPPHTRIGICRRLQGLCADGFPGDFLAAELGISKRYIQVLRTDRNTHHRPPRSCSHDQVIIEVFDRLGGTDPAKQGLSSTTVLVTQERARRQGYVKSNFWDWDTIDDPDAHPEYTGGCGTRWGYDLHTERGIPSCEACRAAMRVYNAEKRWEKAVLAEHGIMRGPGQVSLAEQARRELILKEARRVRNDPERDAAYAKVTAHPDRDDDAGALADGHAYPESSSYP